MGKRFGTATLTVGIAAGALAGVAVGAPLLASAAGTSTPSPVASSPAVPGDGQRPDRQAELETALKSLVADGTITQAQADKVAAKLAQALPMGGMGRHGDGDPRGAMHGMRDLVQGGLDAAAKALGMTTDQVRQGLESGKSLATLAKEKGVAPSKVVDALVAEANTRIDQAVKDGQLAADQAAMIKSTVKDRISSMIDQAPPAFGRGPGGLGRDGGFGGIPGSGTSNSSSGNA